MGVKKCLTQKIFHRETLSLALLIITLCFQGVFLNEAIVNWRGHWYRFLYFGDGVVLFTLVLIALFSRRTLNDRRMRGDNDPYKDDKPDSVRFIYITWFVYALVLSVKVVIMFHKHAHEIEEEGLFSENSVKTVVALTPLVFLTLIVGHHNGKYYEKRRYYISLLLATVVFDLFDSIELLEYLFISKDKRPYSQIFADALLSFSVLNFFLPILALLELRFNHFSGRSPSLVFKTTYIVSFIFLVNIPNFVMRIILWNSHTMEVSVLLMKNVVCIFAGFFELYEFLCELRPKKCKFCHIWYDVSSHKCHTCKSHGNGTVVENNNSEINKGQINGKIDDEIF